MGLCDTFTTNCARAANFPLKTIRRPLLPVFRSDVVWHFDQSSFRSKRSVHRHLPTSCACPSNTALRAVLDGHAQLVGRWRASSTEDKSETTWASENDNNRYILVIRRAYIVTRFSKFKERFELLR